MVTEQAVYEVLQTCYDPEIPVNVVDLGLVYGVAIDGSTVLVDLTLTSVGCPLAGELVAQVRNAILSLDGVEDTTVNLVWSPPWVPSMATEEGKQLLAMMGVPV